MRTTRWKLELWTGLVAIALVAGAPVIAWGQETVPSRTRQPKPKPAEPAKPAEEPEPAEEPAEEPAPTAPAAPPTQPGKPAAPSAQPAVQPAKTLVEPGPYLEKYRPRDYNVTVNVEVRADRSNQFDGNNQPVIGQFKFDTLAMVFPFLTETSAAKPDESTLRGWIALDDRRSDKLLPKILGAQLNGRLYHSGVKLLRFDFTEPGVARSIEMEFTFQTTTAQARFNEPEAMKVAWPKGDWPPAAAACLQPQMFIDYDLGAGASGMVQAMYDTAGLRALLDQWTKGDPKAVSPVSFAKYAAGQMVANFQITGDGLQFLHTGQLQGFDLRGVPRTIEERKGSVYDLTSVLVALYRTAGLPARLVIGIDETSGGPDNFLNKNKGAMGLTCWAEFCLYDETKGTVNWVPVDLGRMRQSGSRPGPFDRPWKYFGSHPEMDKMIPLAFGFHPPTTVESYGAPAMWGWLMTPTPPNRAYQAVRFNAAAAAKRADDDKKKSKK